MHSLAILFQWLVDHPLAAAAGLFGGIALIVMLVTYVQAVKVGDLGVEEGR